MNARVKTHYNKTHGCCPCTMSSMQTWLIVRSAKWCCTCILCSMFTAYSRIEPENLTRSKFRWAVPIFQGERLHLVRLYPQRGGKYLAQKYNSNMWLITIHQLGQISRGRFKRPKDKTWSSFISVYSCFSWVHLYITEQFQFNVVKD